jgi:hypothetical protein
MIDMLLSAETASSLLGMAICIGMRMGLHRDPILYNFTPFDADIRSRAWTWLLILDQPTYRTEGADSIFDYMPWIPPPANVNDDSWASLVEPDQQLKPQEIQGITGMTYTIMQRELMYFHRTLRTRLQTFSPQQGYQLITEFDVNLRRKYIDYVDDQDPAQVAIAMYHEVNVAVLRLYFDASLVDDVEQRDPADRIR